MKPCLSAGTPCPREAVLTVRTTSAGDLPLCQPCHQTYTDLGLPMRVLDPHAPVPEWRRRSLARDFTGRVLGAA